MKPGRSLTIAALLVAVALFIGINLLSNVLMRSARIDLTEDGLYTVSDGTRSVMAELQEPLLIRFFFSEKLATQVPTIIDYANRVRELLEEYVNASNGMITLEIIDPEPFTDSEDEAVALGLQGAPVGAAGEQLYLGMVATNTTDDTEVVPFFQPDREQFLEYDLTRAFYNLANPKKNVIGLISTLPMNGGMTQNPQTGQPQMQQPWVIMQQIGQFFEIRDLGTSVLSIDEDISLLMVVHPRELPDETLFNIDQFALRGGRILMFVDAFSETAAATPGNSNPLEIHASNPEGLLAAWGVKMDPGMVATDIKSARRVQVGGADGRPQVVPYLPWLDLRQENFDGNEVLTSELDRINISTGGILERVEDSGTVFTPLVFTSELSQPIERYNVQFQPDPIGLLENFEPINQSLVLAARVSGPASTSFPDGPPEAVGEIELSTVLADGTVSVIVFSDTDMLADRSWVQMQGFMGQSLAIPVASNGALVSNAVDILSGSDELISLRSRGTSVREFEVVSDIRREAEARYRETERTLQQRLQETEAKLAELQTQEGGDGLVLTDEQQEAVAVFREELVTVRRELRDVRRALQEDIEGLGFRLKALNIGLVPVLITIFALVLSATRSRRRKASRSSEALA